MPAPSDCLAALLGLSLSGSPCFPLPDIPQSGGFDYALPFAFGDGGNYDQQEITASGSGYYLDQLIEFRIASGNGAIDLYDRMNRARALGALNLRAKLRMGSGAPTFIQKGRLGGFQSNGQAGTVGALQLPTSYREDGALRITSVRLDTTTADTDVVLLLDGEPVAVLATTNATQAVQLLIPLDGETHTLEAQLSPGVRPLVNKLFCPGCSAGSPWGKAVAQNLRITNVTSGQGFTLQVEEACIASITDLICYAIADEDLKGMLGQAMAYSAATEMAKSLLTDSTVSRYTMLEPKLLLAMGENFQGEADAAIKWLNSSEGLGRIQHPCFTCKPGVFDPRIVKVA